MIAMYKYHLLYVMKTGAIQTRSFTLKHDYSVLFCLPLHFNNLDATSLPSRNRQMANIDPIKAIPKDKGWACMCLLGKARCVIFYVSSLDEYCFSAINFV